MEEKDLIFDWNAIDYEITREPNNHPHELWFDDETLRDGETRYSESGSGVTGCWTSACRAHRLNA